MNKITNYNEFLIENQLQLLLEANIVFDDKFKVLLDLIDSPIKNRILNLQGVDVDVNTNFISFNTDKEDKVSFLPDDKVKKLKTTFDGNVGSSYYWPTDTAFRVGKYPNLQGRAGRPSGGQEIEVVTYVIPLNTIQTTFTEYKVYNGFDANYLEGNTLGLIKWEDNGILYMSLCDTKCIKKDTSKLKPSEIAVGRFTRALLTKAGEEVDNKELEDFVSKYKAAVLIEKEAFTRFMIVKGDDIKYWYNENQYEKCIGTLGSSCMRYERCEDYLEIYTKNPEQANLIILKSRTNDEKIVARAILWTDDKDRKFMDRIYVQNHADISLFIEYAIQNNFHYKLNQTYGTGDPIMFNGKELTMEESILYVKLEHDEDYDYYPYMDTLKYYKPSKGLLSNSDEDYKYELTDTDGGDGSCSECGGCGTQECQDCSDGTRSCYRCDGEGNMYCEECDGDGKIECEKCDGNGSTTCSGCDGDGSVSCSDCDGEGEIDGETCNTCSGKGLVNCDDCDGNGINDCKDCKGDGKVECDNCEGDGNIECSRCDGAGTQECDECGGDGRVNCYECNS